MVIFYSYVRLPEGTPLEMGEAHALRNHPEWWANWWSLIHPRFTLAMKNDDSQYHYNSIYLPSGNGCNNWLLKPWPIEIVDLAIKHH